MEMWQLQDAKNKFSQVVNLAASGKPQYVTRHGKPVAVVTSVEDYEVSHGKKEPEMNFVEFLLSGSKMPEEWFANGADPFARIKGGEMRKIDFGE